MGLPTGAYLRSERGKLVSISERRLMMGISLSCTRTANYR